MGVRGMRGRYVAGYNLLNFGANQETFCVRICLPTECKAPPMCLIDFPVNPVSPVVK